MEESDFEAWMKSVTQHLKREAPSTVTISKVPERLRRGKNDAYEPRIISFGPYHHGKPSLQAMEKYKRSFLKVILSFRPQIPLERYIDAIKEEEANIRTCYTDYFKIDREEFVKMMLIDSCFLVGHLLQIYYCSFPSGLELDSIVGMNDLLRYDILLLENQLPFFILNKIFELLQFTPTSYPSSFMDLAIHYFDCWVYKKKVSYLLPEPSNFPPPESVHHLLHLYHSHCLYTPQAGKGSAVSTHGEESDRPYTPQAGEGSLVSTHGEESDHQPPSDTVLSAADSISVPISGEESDPIRRPQPPSATVLHEAEGGLVSTHGEESDHQPPSDTVLPAADSISVPISGEESDPIHRPQPPSATVLHEAEGGLVSTHGEESDHQPPSDTVLPEEDSISVPISGASSTLSQLPPATLHGVLDCCIHVPIDGEESGPRHRPQPPSATVLHEAGVKFEKKKEDGSSSLDVTFDITNGKMMIPALVIDTFNKSKLRNLVAFEQLYPNFDELDKSFTAYVEFMDFIVNTPEDVALLHKEGIICHYLGSDKNAADFLNDLNQGVFVKEDHYLAPLYEDVYDYQQKKINKWRAMLRHNYCNSPWKILGIVTGGILLVLTLLQTIFSGISAF